MERCKKQIPNYHELNQVGADTFGHMAKGMLAKVSSNIQKEQENHH